MTLIAKPLPEATRPRFFAGIELLTDLLYMAREASHLDYESIAITCVVNEAGMRPLLVGPRAPLEFVNLAAPPDELRGSISRALIAERTGLPRETVRRKVKKMIEAGSMMQDADGGVRPAQWLARPDLQNLANDIFAAVRRYDNRLRSLGCEGVHREVAAKPSPKKTRR